MKIENELECEFCNTSLTFVESVELPEEETNIGKTFLCKECFKHYQKNPMISFSKWHRKTLEYQETKAKLEREEVSDFLFKEVNKINDRYRKTLERKGVLK